MNRRTFLEDMVVVGATVFVPTTSNETSPTGQVFLRLDAVNLNNRIYPKDLMGKLVAQAEGVTGRLFPNYSQEVTRVADFSHIVRNVSVDDQLNMRGELEILDTPSGRRLRALLKDDPNRVAFRTFGVGSVSTNDQGVQVVDDDYELKAVDAILSDHAA
jgi:hypothetical protein